MHGQLLEFNNKNTRLHALESYADLLHEVESRKRELLWINIESMENSEFEDMLTLLNLHDEDKSRLMQIRHFPYASSLSSGGFVLRMPLRIPGSSINLCTVQYITIIILPQIVMTRIEAHLSVFEKAEKRLLEKNRPAVNNSAELLLYLLEAILETEIANLLIARNGIKHLAAAAEDDISRLDPRKLTRFRRRVGNLAGQAEEKLFALTLLANLLARDKSFESIRSGIVEQIGAHNHLLRSLQRVQERIGELMQLADSHAREQTEQRLRVLTIISAVFMPLTFITGFYGMNFSSMPFLENEWGFPVVICLMLGMGAGLIVFFRKRGWFN